MDSQFSFESWTIDCDLRMAVKFRLRSWQRDSLCSPLDKKHGQVDLSSTPEKPMGDDPGDPRFVGRPAGLWPGTQGEPLPLWIADDVCFQHQARQRRFWDHYDIAISMQWFARDGSSSAWPHRHERPALYRTQRPGSSRRIRAKSWRIRGTGDGWC